MLIINQCYAQQRYVYLPEGRTTFQTSTAVSGTNGITKMHLYNFYTGLLVKEWTYQETESDNYNLNIVGVQAGLYVLEMERNNKMCSVKVIVK